MPLSLVEVPYMAGDDRHPASAGPARLRDAALAHGIAAAVERVDRDAPFRDTASAAAVVNERLAAVVRRLIDEGRLPLVLAGSCNAALGVVAALDAARCGAVWIDAHADFNTPETTVSGYFPGMSAAVVTGACFRGYWRATPLPEDKLVLLGVRDVSPAAERERLERSAVRVVEWRDGKPHGEPLALLDALAESTDDVYLHIDFDAFAPDVAPATVDEPVPGGLSLADAETVVTATIERFRIRAATLATYTPERDEDDKTLRAGVRLIELISAVS